MLNSPIGSMYGIFTNIYPINDPNVGKYAIHGSYGSVSLLNYQRVELQNSAVPSIWAI